MYMNRTWLYTQNTGKITDTVDDLGTEQTPFLALSAVHVLNLLNVIYNTGEKPFKCN
jgi:hypothetical protein